MIFLNTTGVMVKVIVLTDDWYIMARLEHTSRMRKATCSEYTQNTWGDLLILYKQNAQCSVGFFCGGTSLLTANESFMA